MPRARLGGTEAGECFAERLLACASDAFGAARTRTATRSVRLRLARYRVGVEAAGPLGERLLVALAHAACDEAGAAHLSIKAFDSGSSGVPLPWGSEREALASLNGLEDERFRGSFDPARGSLYLLDVQRGLGVLWLRRADDLPAHELTAPFRVLFHWWLRSQGHWLVHAGALAGRDGGVLLVGRGGSGKSTVALSCLQAGYAHAADDYAGLLRGSEPRAANLYQAAKLDVGDLGREFPALASRVHRTLPASNGRRKAVLLLGELFPGRLAPEVTLSAVVWPRLAAVPRACLAPIPSALGLRALLPSTVAQLPRDTRLGLRELAGMLGRLPHYALQLGGERASTVTALAPLLGPPC